MLLRSKGIKTLLFAGVTTACCVATTMREAADLGFACHILADCTGDCSESDYFDTLRMARNDQYKSRVLTCALLLADVYSATWPPTEGSAAKLEAVGHQLPAVKRLKSNRSSDLPSDLLGAASTPLPTHIWTALSVQEGDERQLHEAKLAASARVCIEQLQQRAASEGVIDRGGHTCIAADDFGRTGAWPHEPKTLTRRKLAILSVDVEEAHREEAAAVEAKAGAQPPSSEWLAQLRLLEAAAEAAGVLIVRVAPHHATGFTEGKTLTLPKPRGQGAFSGTYLEAWLHRLGVCNLLLVGDGAATGVNTTMRQASDRGFDTLVVADCVGAETEADLYGVTASQIRRIVFSACAHSDAVNAWLRTVKL